MSRSLQGAAMTALLVPAAVVVVGAPASADVCSSLPVGGQTCQTVSTLLGGSPTTTTTTTQSAAQSTTTTTAPSSSPVAVPTTLPPLPVPVPSLPAPLPALPLPGSSPSDPAPASPAASDKTPAAATVSASAPAAATGGAAPTLSTGSPTGTAAGGELARGTGLDLPAASAGGFDLGPAPLPAVRTRTFAPGVSQQAADTTVPGSLRRQLPPLVVGLAFFLLALVILAHAFANSETAMAQVKRTRR